MRILIVEDEVKIRTGMAKLISAHTAHTVVGEAKNGQEGLEMLLELSPDIVITDIRMPVMDGLEMLSRARGYGVGCHFVILSGYSEFEYAQKALRWGADDYLLKPLAPEDVTELLDKMQRQVEEEERQRAESAEGIFREILLGGQAGMESLEKLESAGQFAQERPYFLVAGYLGDVDAGYAAKVRRLWEELGRRNPSYTVLRTELASSREVFCLIQGEEDSGKLCEKLQELLYRGLAPQDLPVWAMCRLDSLGELAGAGELLRGRYLYGMRLGYRCVITSEAVEALEEEPCRYPAALENQIRMAICQSPSEELERCAGEFMAAMRGMACSPVYIRRSYERIASFVENVCAEVNQEAFGQMQSQEAARSVSEAVTTGMLERSFQRMIRIILSSQDRREDIRNYTIRRAINYIREHYQENISLEQIAERLEITPEYLSTLFNKEVGINFTTFLKRFRISHAKRLLKGTDKKIYEVSGEVGYNDPKYFARVFKDEVGVSPGEYRQMG